ncbi:MAG: hypothetical protein K2X27_08800 [Candidatus Obscuribacterales bacterium]|nr:hypothetical protein [Candidatus Obscuribacterales bacterium]
MSDAPQALRSENFDSEATQAFSFNDIITSMEKGRGAAEAIAFFDNRTQGKIEIGEKDFDKIGPKAAQVLRDAGVTKLSIQPGKDSDHYEVEFKKALEIPQDPATDGSRKLTLGPKFEADVKRDGADSYTIDKIKGLTAESKILFQWREAQVDKIQLRKGADGNAEITSSGSFAGVSKEQTRSKPAEILEKAKILFERIENMKPAKSSFLEIPKLPHV